MQDGFFAAIVKEIIHIEGDERSRTNPGHGYPAHDIKIDKIIKFANKPAMEKWVEEQENYRYAKKDYELICYTPLEVQTTTVIKVSKK